jgi:protein O-mannosyl-transferase
MKDKTNVIVAVSLLLVLLATTLIYWPGLSGPFLLDDTLNIVSAYVGSFDFNELYYAVTHNKSGTFGRPVSIFSLVISGIVHGPEPWGYKFHNLVIHLINGLLIFWLLLKLLPKLSPLQTREQILLIAGLVAAIWLLHPLLVSTVLYAVQRMAQLTSLFILVALLVYTYAREGAGETGLRFYWLAYVVLPICTVLSILAKENGVLIPLFIFAIEFIVYQFAYISVLARNRIMLFLGLFVFLPVLTGSLYLFTHLEKFANYTIRDFDMAERLMTQLHVVASYMKMILLPTLSDMTLFHDYVAVTRSFDTVTGVLFLVLCLAIFLVFYLWKKAPVLSFAIAWFLISHLLESTFFSLELMFEHRNYLAAVGPLLALVYYMFNIPTLPKLRYLSAIFLLLVAVLTTIRVQEWKSEEMILQIAVAEHPDSGRAQSELANLKYNRGDLEGALEHLSMAQQNSPREFGPVLHEIALRCTSGTEIQNLLDEAIIRAENYPVTAYSLNSIDNLLVMLNESRCPEMDLDKLLSVIEAAESQPENRQSTLPIGFLEKVKGQIYLLKGDYIKGIEFALSGYDKTGMTSILGNLTRNLIQLNLLGDAENIIRIMESINSESGGSETALIEPLREQLQSVITQQDLLDRQIETREL